MRLTTEDQHFAGTPFSDTYLCGATKMPPPKTETEYVYYVNEVTCPACQIRIAAAAANGIEIPRPFHRAEAEWTAFRERIDRILREAERKT